MALKQQVQFSNALILQGDWEGGMANLALDLMDAGKAVTKIVLHAGDWVYRWKGVPTVRYDAPFDLFEDWLRNHIKQSKIDCLILYNQYRPYNAIGWDLAKEFGLECVVLEQGLLRPDFCSIYTPRCNEFDYLAKKWDSVLSKQISLSEPKQAASLATMSTPRKISQFALHYTFSRLITLVTRKYKHYRDQRTLKFSYHLAAGIRGALRFQGREKQARYNTIFATKWSGKYYFVPLQVHTDSQIGQRSKFKSMEKFIRKVVHSFNSYAPPGTKLVFKVHPMDRGYKDYRKLIKKLQAKAGGHRILYLDRIHLPTALDHARACITINSSVGLSALIHNTPTIALGEAAYNLKGLTYRGELDDFWTEHGKANKQLVHNYVALLKLTSQAQGTLYQRLYATPGRCKIVWPEEFRSMFDDCPKPEHNTLKRSASLPARRSEASQQQLHSTI